MKRRKCRGIALVLAVSLLTGCGTPLFELTEEEEDIIVAYSAYAVAKHNIFQKDGYVNVTLEEDEPTTESQKEEVQEDQENDSTAQGEGAEEESAMGETVSLAQLIGRESELKISYKGFEICENYNEGNYFSLGADKGKRFLVVKFRMKNISDSDIELNNAEYHLKFACSCDGQEAVPEEMTFALKEFSMYEGKLKKGKSADVVLLFQVNSESADQIQAINLTVSQDGVTKNIQL